MTWPDLAPDDPFGVHNLPYGAFDAKPSGGDGEGGQVALGVRLGDDVLNLSAAEERGLIEARGDARGGRRRSTVSSLWAGPRGSTSGTRSPISLPMCATATPSRLCSGHSTRSVCACRSPWGTTSTSTRRSTMPPTSGGSSGRTSLSCHPPGSTCRSATTVARERSSCQGRRSSVRAASAQRPMATGRPTARRSRLDVEAEVGFVVGRRHPPRHSGVH